MSQAGSGRTQLNRFLAAPTFAYAASFARRQLLAAQMEVEQRSDKQRDQPCGSVTDLTLPMPWASTLSLGWVGLRMIEGSAHAIDAARAAVEKASTDCSLSVPQAAWTGRTFGDDELPVTAAIERLAVMLRAARG